MGWRDTFAESSVGFLGRSFGARDHGSSNASNIRSLGGASERQWRAARHATQLANCATPCSVKPKTIDPIPEGVASDNGV